MKKILKIVIGFFLFVSLLGVVAGFYVSFFLPDIPVKNLKIELTKERIERGKYLANCVLVCVDCHSTRDWSRFSGPIVPGTEGNGGEIFDQKMGLPGTYIATNITPYGLANWSDGEIYRAITSGVGKRNNVIFPIMPYASYGNLDEEDIFSVIAYLRSIPSVKQENAISKSDFPVNIIVHTMAVQGHPSKKPAPSDSLKYGEYLTKAAACLDCHTPFEGGKLLLDKAYAGGRAFPSKEGGVVISPNISFDKKTGIGNWNQETFVATFKYFDLPNNETRKIAKGHLNSPMPWTMYAKMETNDLRAIFNYLKSLAPIENSVAKTEW